MAFVRGLSVHARQLLPTQVRGSIQGPYRKAPGRDFAIAELRRHAGTQFDSCVVDALCRALETPDSTPAAVPVSGSRPRVALPLPSAA